MTGLLPDRRGLALSDLADREIAEGRHQDFDDAESIAGDPAILWRRIGGHEIFGEP
jgi:hypothetical protein